MEKKPNKESMLTLDRLRELVSYDPVSGIFTNRTIRSNSVKIGCQAGGEAGKNGYRFIGIDHRRFLTHRLAWFYHYGEWPNGVIDHIDGDGGNNAINNLRDATHRENSANRLRDRSLRADAAKWRAYQKSIAEAASDKPPPTVAAVAAPPAQQWVSVPVEPTPEMLDASDARCHAGLLYPQDMTHGPRMMRRREWQAMLAAAPQHQGGGK